MIVLMIPEDKFHIICGHSKIGGLLVQGPLEVNVMV